VALFRSQAPPSAVTTPAEPAGCITVTKLKALIGIGKAELRALAELPVAEIPESQLWPGIDAATPMRDRQSSCCDHRLTDGSPVSVIRSSLRSGGHAHAHTDSSSTALIVRPGLQT
jgi:hypothetical protein